MNRYIIHDLGSHLRYGHDHTILQLRTFYHYHPADLRTKSNPKYYKYYSLILCNHRFLEFKNGFHYLAPDRAFHYASATGDPNLVELVIKLCDYNDLADLARWGLSGACEAGSYDIAKWMISLGADPTFGNALDYLATRGDFRMLELLLGACDMDSERTQILHQTLLYICRYKTSDRNLKLFNYLIDHHHVNNFDDGLRHASYTGNLPTVKLLVEKGAQNYQAGIKAARQAYSDNQEVIDYLQSLI